MKVGIIGSSYFKDKRFVYNELNNFRKVIRFDLIVSGGAPGPDTFAEEYADEFKIPKKIIKANWDDMAPPCFKKTNSAGKEYNALAGFNRNTEIIKSSDIIIAFWDNQSPGTRDSIKKAINAGKKVFKVKI